MSMSGVIPFPTTAASDIPEGWRSRIVGTTWSSPDDLMAHPDNARIHPPEQREAMTGSLNTLGWVNFVLVSQRTGRIVDGHERVWQAIHKQEETGEACPVPVALLDLSDAEEAAVLAVLDEISNMGRVDRNKMLTLLERARSLKLDARLKSMLADLRERHSPLAVLPPQETEAAYTDNKYPIPDYMKQDEGDGLPDASDVPDGPIKTVMVYMPEREHETFMLQLKALGQSFQKRTVTDIIRAVVDWSYDQRCAQESEAQDA